MKWIAARRRESRTWVIVGPCPYDKREKLRPGKNPWNRRAYAIITEQRSPYSWECPEHKSCFFDAHKVIEANTKEEAENLCRT